MIIQTALRPTRVYSIRFQPALLAPCCAASFSTAPAASTRPAKIQRTENKSASIAQKSTVRASFQQLRHASTAPPTESATAAPSSTSSPSASTQLTWNRFLSLRRTRRQISVVASSVSAVATTFTGLRFFIEGNYDSIWAASFGLDPIVVSGLTAVGLMAVGWLLGPFFGNAVFNGVNRGLRREIETKERQFYARIKKHRVDPTSSSMANPVPDYYGEKIGSVSDYRRWLKDQRAFNLKRGAYAGSK